MGVKGVCTGIGAAYRTTRSNKISASQARQRNAYGRINVCTYVVNKIMARLMARMPVRCYTWSTSADALGADVRGGARTLPNREQ